MGKNWKQKEKTSRSVIDFQQTWTGISGTVRWDPGGRSEAPLDRAALQHAVCSRRPVDARHSPDQHVVGGWVLPRGLRVLGVEGSHHLLLWHRFSPQVSSQHGDAVSSWKRPKRNRSAKVILLGCLFFVFFNAFCKPLSAPKKNQIIWWILLQSVLSGTLTLSVVGSSFSTLRYYLSSNIILQKAMLQKSPSWSGVHPISKFLQITLKLWHFFSLRLTYK